MIHGLMLSQYTFSLYPVTDRLHIVCLIVTLFKVLLLVSLDV